MLPQFSHNSDNFDLVQRWGTNGPGAWRDRHMNFLSPAHSPPAYNSMEWCYKSFYF